MKTLFQKRKLISFCFLCGVLLLFDRAYAVDIVISQQSMNDALGLMRVSGALNFHQENLHNIDVISVHVQSVGIKLLPENKVSLLLNMEAYAEKQWGIAWSISATFDVTADVKLIAGLVDEGDLSKGYKVTVEVQSVDISNWQTTRSTIVGTWIPNYIFSAYKDDIVSWLTSAIPKYSVTAGIGIMKNIDNKYVDIVPIISTDGGQLTLSFKTFPSQTPTVGWIPPSVMQGIVSLLEPTPGDINDDGAVDKIDLNLLLKDLNMSTVASACGLPCDLNGDGKINVLDARILVTLCTLPLCAH